MSETRDPRDRLAPAGGMEAHQRDMTVTVSADVTLGAMQHRLADLDQWVPIDGDPDAPLGRLVQFNSTGPLRLGFGAWRDLLLGVQFLNGRGELITGGGRTVKNVAGYDLTKLMVGQRGAFGDLVTLTMRTYRRPTAALLVTAAPHPEAMARLLPSAARPQWTMIASDSLYLGYLGDEPTIAYYELAVRQHTPVPLHQLDVRRLTVEEATSVRSRWWSAARVSDPDSGLFTFRASVPPARLTGSLLRELPPDAWAADPAFGIVVGRCTAIQRAALQKAVSDIGGTVVFDGNSGATLGTPLNPAVAALLTRLKAAFDPDHRLTPLPNFQQS